MRPSTIFVYGLLSMIVASLLLSCSQTHPLATEEIELLQQQQLQYRNHIRHVKDELPFYYERHEKRTDDSLELVKAYSLLAKHDSLEKYLIKAHYAHSSTPSHLNQALHALNEYSGYVNRLALVDSAFARNELFSAVSNRFIKKPKRLHKAMLISELHRQTYQITNALGKRGLMGDCMPRYFGFYSLYEYSPLSLLAQELSSGTFQYQLLFTPRKPYRTFSPLPRSVSYKNSQVFIKGIEDFKSETIGNSLLLTFTSDTYYDEIPMATEVCMTFAPSQHRVKEWQEGFSKSFPWGGLAYTCLDKNNQ